MSKDRLDSLLVDLSYFESREKAKRAIMAGLVLVDGIVRDKAGTMISKDAQISIKNGINPYVSRGGLKIKGAFEDFSLSVKDKICMDIGASTGGFTDFMLRNGAKKVYAIDVGYGQLDYRLRNDERVINIERTNIRTMDPDLIKDSIDFITIDVSFISLNLVIPIAVSFLKEGGLILALVKPQFEAGREQVGKGGIVKDQEVHKEIIVNLIDNLYNWGLIGESITYSPIRGAKGNIEYLFLMKKIERLREGMEIDFSEGERRLKEGLIKVIEEGREKLKKE